MIQNPGHETAANLTQQRVEFPLKAMAELLKQTHPMGK
jgi:hypothetical protein